MTGSGAEHVIIIFISNASELDLQLCLTDHVSCEASTRFFHFTCTLHERSERSHSSANSVTSSGKNVMCVIQNVVKTFFNVVWNFFFLMRFMICCFQLLPVFQRNWSPGNAKGVNKQFLVGYLHT